MTKTWSYVTVTPEEAIKQWLNIDITEPAIEDPTTINTDIE